MYESEEELYTKTAQNILSVCTNDHKSNTKIRKIGFVITTLPIHFKEQPKPKVFCFEFSYLRTKPEIVTCQCILESRKYHNMKTM